MAKKILICNPLGIQLHHDLLYQDCHATCSWVLTGFIFSWIFTLRSRTSPWWWPFWDLDIRSNSWNLAGSLPSPCPGSTSSLLDGTGLVLVCWYPQTPLVGDHLPLALFSLPHALYLLCLPKLTPHQSSLVPCLPRGQGQHYFGQPFAGQTQ